MLDKIIDVVGSVITGSQSAAVEAARINADANEKRDQRDYETRQLIMNATKEQLQQAQENLRESNRSFKEMMESMQATARETNEAQRKQLADLMREQAEKEREMSKATIEEREAMRKEHIEARKQKEEEMTRIREENYAREKEEKRQHEEKMEVMKEEVQRLNKEQLEMVQECSKTVLEQAQQHGIELNKVHEDRRNDLRENAEKIDALHRNEINLTRGFAAAMINMTISQANSRETASIVELSNSLRESLTDTEILHHNAVESAQIALNDYNFLPATVQFGSLGQRIDSVATKKAELVRALNRANSSNKEIIAKQMTAIGHLELALRGYRSAVGSLRAKMTSTTPDITQSDIDEFNATQLELTRRMIEMPLIDANDVYGEITANAKEALEGHANRALEQ